jgi:O-acetylhomoserine/O-acetylserine sulfhydrylase-like pyridoxal-dependent enzyme
MAFLNFFTKKLSPIINISIKQPTSSFNSIITNELCTLPILSIGVENFNDIIWDIEQALAGV